MKSKISLWLAAPVLSFLSFYLGLSVFLNMLYLAFFHLPPLAWLYISCRGYNQRPSAEAVAQDTYKYPAEIEDKWQLLLFPMQVGPWQYEETRKLFLRAGFRPWEGKMVAALCALALKGDPLDDFDENWGLPIRYENIMFQFILSCWWESLMAAAHFFHHAFLWGSIFLGLAILQLLAILFFFFFQRYRMPRVKLASSWALIDLLEVDI